MNENHIDLDKLNDRFYYLYHKNYPLNITVTGQFFC